MSKSNKATIPAAATTVVSAETQTAAKVAMYKLGKLPRNGLNEATKHGKGGTAGTYQAVVAALATAPDNSLSIAAIQAVCKANNDSGFAKYAVRMRWLAMVAVAA